MSRNKKLIGVAVAVVVLVAAGVTVGLVSSGGSSAKQNETVVFGKVQERSLQDTVALTGTLARKQIRNVTAASQGLVSTVKATNGSTTRAGQVMFALGGRDAIAEDGSVRFFRSLTLGDQGEDVLQLKEILAAAGDNPGPMTNYFNQQTQFALAQWQAQHHYPNATPATPQSVTVSLAQGTGYKLGAQSSAGLIIGPPPAQTTAYSPGSGTGSRSTARLASFQPAVMARPALTPTPVVTIQSVDDQVAQGQPAAFVVDLSAAPTSPLTVNLSAGGTAGNQDVVTPPSSVTVPAGATQAAVSVQTRVNTLVEPDPTVTLSVAAGTGYTVGTPATAQTVIKNDNVPALQITGATTVAPGGSATLTITADQAPLQDTQVGLSAAGSATPGTDYDPVDPVVTLPAGQTSTTVSVDTISSTVIEPDKYVAVSIAPSATAYTVTSPGTAVVTISGSQAQPT
ncbi:MAG TPA: peptidoglycan-binding protein, partial [Acidimicrobiales bacterium]|nr:peptidoglycan-binding protein [Acidimicrobiales bacterium]